MTRAINEQIDISFKVLIEDVLGLEFNEILRSSNELLLMAE